MTPRSVKPEVPILRHVIPSTNEEEEEEEEKRRNSGRRKKDPADDWVYVLKLYPGEAEGGSEWGSFQQDGMFESRECLSLNPECYVVNES